MGRLSIQEFVDRWRESGAAERANKDLFLTELCDTLELPIPNPTTGDPAKDTYTFERDAIFPREGGTVTVGKIDLYREGCFVLEAKQGSETGTKKLGTARRNTTAWHQAMKDAYGQALGYARAFDEAVPFLVVCDIGYCFELYAAFDGSLDYRPFPNAQQSRLFLSDLEEHAELLRKVFLDPYTLDRSKHAAKVTLEVAKHLAKLAATLDREGHDQELSATFLMRCLFTMFAEDIGLLPDKIFTRALRDYWIPNPRSFVGGVESFWQTMNEGGHVFGAGAEILQFNGGLFKRPTALPLNEEGLKLLLEAAERDWSQVEPAIFGTLLERALDRMERARLGAHFTPRAYVERLVRATVEQPLREEWDVVQAEVRQLVLESEQATTKRSSNMKLAKAVKLVRAYQSRLAKVKVLDPACGAGNFLYVTLDLFKTLESEVLSLLESLGESSLLDMETVRITPAQFYGIEVKRWAKEIAELVLWIGYLQWHFRMHRDSLPVPQPVLQDYGQIECRDAVLDYDYRELVLDEKTGRPLTRWSGKTKRSPITGEDIPDEEHTTPVYRYGNPRKAAWPEVDFVVGNPPFVGTKRMRAALGDGYVDALRSTYSSSVEDNADYVMYWWDRAGDLLRAGKIRSFGFITTNSIRHIFNRRVVQRHLALGTRIVWAIPDHPWVDSETGAAVRIAMTTARRDHTGETQLLKVVREADESSALDGSVELEFEETRGGVIHEDLRMGCDVVGVEPLIANRGLSGMGVALHGQGFVLTPDEADKLRTSQTDPTIRGYIKGKDLLQKAQERYVIDFSFMGEEHAREANPAAFQRVVDRVLPERRPNRRKSIREQWWRFGWERPKIRSALRDVSRYIATTETAKHRVFQFVATTILPDHKVIVFASADAFHLGVLSSRVHTVWALNAGGTLEDRPVYNKNVCLDPFPFPHTGEELARKIRETAEALDSHRRQRCVEFPSLTITKMYNVLEKVRQGSQLSKGDLKIHEQALVSVLSKLHGDLDALVCDAYGWPQDMTDEDILDRIVALNAVRHEEEQAGVIRWTRPAYQCPEEGGAKAPIDLSLPLGTRAPGTPGKTDARLPRWPSKFPERIALVRDAVAPSSNDWSAAELAKQFRRAKVSEVVEVMDSLAALGLCVAYGEADGRRWRSTRFASSPPPRR